MEWISVKDKLPPNESEVLFFNGRLWMIDGNKYYVGCHLKKRGKQSAGYYKVDGCTIERIEKEDRPTHWTKLPYFPAGIDLHISCKKYGCDIDEKCNK